MKTQVIYLEPHDDLASAKDKMAWGGGERVLLVWPVHNRMLDSKLALAQIQQHAKTLGKEIGVVVRDGEMRRYAEQLGVPTFRSVRRAQKATWPDSAEVGIDHAPDKDRLKEARNKARQPELNPRLNTPFARLAFFSAGVLAFLSLGAVLLPSAEVRLTPEQETQELTLTVTASTDYTSYNLSGALPARTMRIVAEGRDSMPVTGTISIPQSPAEGEVTFTNLTDQALIVPEGTVLRGVDPAIPHFVTIETGEAPAGGELRLRVQAVDPGSSGNLPAETLVVIEGPLGLSLSATNTEATQGGTDQESPAPSQADYDQLRERLMGALAESTREQAQSELGEGDFIFSQSAEAINIIEETFIPAEPAPANELSLTLRAEFELQYVAWEDLQAMAAAILDTTLSEGFTAQDETLTVTHLSEPDESGSWEVRILRAIQSTLSPSDAIALITGKAPEEAARDLSKAFALDAPPEIRIAPSWWPRLPVLPFRIQVVTG